MRKFVVLLISMSLSLPVYAKETPAPPPKKGSTGTVMLRGQDATTPAAKPTEPAKPAETAAAPAAAPAEATAPAAAPAPAAPTASAPAPAAPAAAAKGEPSAADRLKWPKEIQNAWDQGNNTVKNLILNRIKAGGKLNDKEFKKRVADTLAESQGKKVAAQPKGQKKGAVAAQSVQGPPVPVVDGGAGGEEAPPAVTTRRTRTQSAQRNRDDAYGDVKDKDTDARPRCTDGSCDGTQPAPVLAPQQEAAVRTIVEHTPVKESGSGWNIDWGSFLGGAVVGVGGTLLFQNLFGNRNQNNYQQYCGFGPGGQGYPWWQYPQGRPGGLPSFYRAPGSGFGVGGFGGSYPVGSYGQQYGGAFGSAAGLVPPATLPFPGPSMVGSNMFYSGNAFNTGYNSGFNQLGVQQNMFSNPSLGVPNIVLGR